MVDYMADYLENIRDRRVYPGVQPGYLHKLLPREPPLQPERWDDIFKDVEELIMPGPFSIPDRPLAVAAHARVLPALTCYPSIMGEMLSSAINALCFTWASSPAGTELETIAMNWLGKSIGLPDSFLNEKDNSAGGGVIQTTASEATLVSLLAARTRALIKLSELNPELQSSELLGHLICYCSDQAHSSVEKAGLIGLVRMRYIESDTNQSMRGGKLEEAIEGDKARGLVPFWVCATLGTTGSVAFDNLREVGEVCARHDAWLHVDAAYAGTAFLCPEYRHWLNGVELADSFAFNPSKWMMVNFDCTAMWVKDSTALHRTFNVNPIYLRHENSVSARVARNGFTRFQSLNFDVKDEPRSDRLVTDKVDAILEKVEQDRHISSYNIAEQLEIDHKTALTHLKKLDIQKSSILGSHTSSLKEI
ncbi:Histidine decarboxylase [Eumeta japonica]|uniref:Histidine decarboxylase n=1 Tax=Eumeta variegata TaxID=151549 RepID=A0A4C1XQ11_EUMVA|nr:Histidine decarboxylase [Eumeta japonica]